MAAGTTLDKIGPMCRSAEGAALVLHAMAGPDDRDFSVPDLPVNWDADTDVTELSLGGSYLQGNVRNTARHLAFS